MPVTAEPLAPNARCDSDWTKESAGKQRFYVGGWATFVNLTGIKIDHIVSYKEKAIAEAKAEKWPKMRDASPQIVSGMANDWSTISRPQMFSCGKGRAIIFPKAALFILACELALSDYLANGKGNRNKKAQAASEVAAPESEIWVYNNMGILPAVWNINDFNNSYIEQHLKIDAQFLNRLRDHSEQDNLELFHDLAAGHTVSYETADKIKSYCDNQRGFEKLGKVRARAGKGVLGTKKASENEEVSLD